MMWRGDEVVKFVPREKVTFLEVLQKSFLNPGSIPFNLECDVLWRKCDVIHFGSISSPSPYVSQFGPAVQRGAVIPKVVGSISSAGHLMCDGRLWFKWLKVGVCPWSTASTSGHTSPMSPNELWTCPDDGAARAQAPGCQRSSCGSVRRGRGGTGVASDVVKVQGEDPATPGPLI